MFFDHSYKQLLYRKYDVYKDEDVAVLLMDHLYVAEMRGLFVKSDGSQ